jgi:hypothetical protein
VDKALLFLFLVALWAGLACVAALMLQYGLAAFAVNATFGQAFCLVSAVSFMFKHVDTSSK